MMQKVPSWLEEFKSNVYSQSGEDGVISKILEILPDKNRWCVEFGAWDGQHLSNTRNLIENNNYSAVLIEGDTDRYNDLQNKCSQNNNIIAINKFVGFSSIDNLDTILENTPIPSNFDLLSIDIDGNDFHVWKAITKYRPKVVCIEYNPSIPTEVSFVQSADPTVTQGASLMALVELGKRKGYELISVLRLNAFFVRSDYFQLFQIEDNRPATLRKNFDSITYIFFGYDGSVLLQGCQKLPWHGTDLKQSKMQVLPKYLREYPGNYSKLKTIMLNTYNKMLRLFCL